MTVGQAHYGLAPCLNKGGYLQIVTHKGQISEMQGGNMAEKNKRRTSDNIPDICPEGQQKNRRGSC
jgi:hypothetical protein